MGGRQYQEAGPEVCLHGFRLAWYIPVCLILFNPSYQKMSGVLSCLHWDSDETIPIKNIFSKLLVKAIFLTMLWGLVLFCVCVCYFWLKARAKKALEKISSTLGEILRCIFSHLLS